MCSCSLYLHPMHIANYYLQAHFIVFPSDVNCALLFASPTYCVSRSAHYSPQKSVCQVKEYVNNHVSSLEEKKALRSLQTFSQLIAVLTPLAPHSHMWGQFTLIISSLSPKRDWGPKRVNSPKRVELAVARKTSNMRIYTA